LPKLLANMEFVVAANSGTHVYRAEGLEKPTLLQSWPLSQAGNPHCLEFNAERGIVALLMQTGAVSIWDFSLVGLGNASSPMGQICEIRPQNQAITRCYFSPKGSFLVTWEPLGTIHRVERAAGDEGKGVQITKAENLSAWSLRRPTGCSSELTVEVTKDGKSRLGVNVDNLDGKSGLLIRRVDPGLIENHNRQADSSQAIFPGDVILQVNAVSLQSGVQAMTEEIQRATVLRLRIHRGNGTGWMAVPVARFFAPNISPLRWPPLVWSADELFGFRCVSNEVQILDGHTLRLLRRLQVDYISQMSISPGINPALGGPPAMAAFCPAGASASPAMVRVYTDFGKAAVKTAKAALTKSFFSDAAYATLRWEPSEGMDLLVLVHSSELTEADLEGRTLHGQGGNGLYLLRAEETMEPIASLSGSQDGVILDVQWCPAVRSDRHSVVVLQGPQPALVSVFSYCSGGGGAPQRVNLGRFGVRNCLRWDNHGMSFCLRTQSLHGAGVSSEADSLDLFDASPSGPIARRAGTAVGGKRDREQAIGPAVISAEFSPDGRVMAASIEAHKGAELKFLNVEDGSTLYRLKFDEIYAARWRPVKEGAFPEPQFEPPPPEAQAASMAIIDVDLKDREALIRRLKAVQLRLKEIEKLKVRGERDLEALDPQQREKLGGEPEARSTLARLEAELETLDEPNLNIFEVRTAWGTHTLECRAGESIREVARRFCRERKMDGMLANMLAAHMEQRLAQPAGHLNLHGSPIVGAAPEAFKIRGARKGPKPRVVDLGDKEAIRRRVKTLQKKLREIERLRGSPEGSLDSLQREKLATEEDVSSEIVSLERELDLMERLPKMVFDVDTDDGVQHIEFRDGDDCYELARNFCDSYGLGEELVDPLAQHMKLTLSEQAPEALLQS